MISSFFRNALLRLVLSLTVKGVYLFAIERTVQNRLPEAEYGFYFSLLGLSMILQVIADAGLQLYASRTISGHRQLLAKYFPYFLGLKVLLGGLFFAAVLTAGYALGYRGAEMGLLLFVATGQLLNSLVLYLRSGVAGLGRYAADSWLSIVDKVTVIAIVGAVLWWMPERLSIFFFAGAQVLGWSVTALLAGLLLRGKLGRLLPRFGAAKLLMLLRGGAPYAIAILLQVAYTRTDAVMIERLLPEGATAAGHYAAGYRLLDALNTVGWLLTGLLLPMYARLHARRQDLGPLLRFSVHLLLAGGIVAAVTGAAFAGPIVEALYDFAEPRTAWILYFLSLSFVAQCLNYGYGALLGATGLIGRMNYVFAGGIVVNVVGNLLLLPRYGASGAAAMTLVTQAGVAVVQAVCAHRWLRLPGATVDWLRLICLWVTTTGAAWLVGSYIPSLPLALATLLGAGLGMTFVLRLLSIGGLRSLLVGED